MSPGTAERPDRLHLSSTFTIRIQNVPFIKINIRTAESALGTALPTPFNDSDICLEL